MTQAGNSHKAGPPTAEQVATAVVEQRGQVHGESWLIHSEIIGMVVSRFHQASIFSSFAASPWFGIFRKMMRVMHNPYHLDSWIDIIGYAKLVADKLMAEQSEKGHEIR
jgi:hypothetical protein